MASTGCKLIPECRIRNSCENNEMYHILDASHKMAYFMSLSFDKFIFNKTKFMGLAQVWALCKSQNMVKN